MQHTIFKSKLKKEFSTIFSGDLDVNTIIRKAKLFFNQNYDVEDTALIFEEIGNCQLARTALKSFALDKRL